MWYKILSSFLFASTLFSSCVLRSSSTSLTKYQQAMQCYVTQKYHEASGLFKEALPLLQGKAEEASAHFYQAYCHFYQKKYVQSSEAFKYFHETFLGDPRIEEALYMQGHALYLGSPSVKRDQTLTREAVSILRDYRHRYPQGVYSDKALAQLGYLHDKLALKAFNNARLYHQLKHYRAAVVTLENLQKDFPTSPYSEKAAYLKADAQCRYIKETEGDEQKEQLAIATKYCQVFLARYSDSAYASSVKTLYKNLSAVAQSKKR